MKCFVGEFKDLPQDQGIILTGIFDLVHPRNFNVFISELREQYPNLIFWTNNSRVLDYLTFEEVFVFCKDGDKIRIKSLKEHPKFNYWKEEFHPGEMWSVFGDQWVIEDSSI